MRHPLTTCSFSCTAFAMALEGSLSGTEVFMYTYRSKLHAGHSVKGSNYFAVVRQITINRRSVPQQKLSLAC